MRSETCQFSRYEFEGIYFALVINYGTYDSKYLLETSHKYEIYMRLEIKCALARKLKSSFSQVNARVLDCVEKR